MLHKIKVYINEDEIQVVGEMILCFSRLIIVEWRSIKLFLRMITFKFKIRQKKRQYKKNDCRLKYKILEKYDCIPITLITKKFQKPQQSNLYADEMYFKEQIKLYQRKMIMSYYKDQFKSIKKKMNQQILKQYNLQKKRKEEEFYTSANFNDLYCNYVLASVLSHMTWKIILLLVLTWKAKPLQLFFILQREM